MNFIKMRNISFTYTYTLADKQTFRQRDKLVEIIVLKVLWDNTNDEEIKKIL